MNVYGPNATRKFHFVTDCRVKSLMSCNDALTCCCVIISWVTNGLMMAAAVLVARRRFNHLAAGAPLFTDYLRVPTRTDRSRADTLISCFALMLNERRVRASGLLAAARLSPWIFLLSGLWRWAHALLCLCHPSDD